MKIFDNLAPWGTVAPTGIAKALVAVCHALPTSSKLFYSLNKGLRGSLKSGQMRSFDVQALDLNLRLVNKGNFCETTALFAPQFYDCEERNWLKKCLGAGDIFLDIGANIGLYSLVVAKMHAEVGVFAIEPDPKLSDRMKFNASTNNLTITHLPVALSNYEGSASLDTSAKQSGENVLLEKNQESHSSHEVEVTTLPMLCERNGITRIGMIKIDIEGHEHKVLSHFLANAPESLWPRYIIIEHVHDNTGVMSLLQKEGGYQIENQTNRNSLLVRKAT